MLVNGPNFNIGNIFKLIISLLQCTNSILYIALYWQNVMLDELEKLVSISDEQYAKHRSNMADYMAELFAKEGR